MELTVGCTCLHCRNFDEVVRQGRFDSECLEDLKYFGIESPVYVSNISPLFGDKPDEFSYSVNYIVKGRKIKGDSSKYIEIGGFSFNIYDKNEEISEPPFKVKYDEILLSGWFRTPWF